MLSLVARRWGFVTASSSSSVPSALVSATASAGSRRLFSDSHDDFKPKKKEVPTGADDVTKLIEKQIKENDVMLYMKGTPSAPQCGFSSQAVRILNAVGVDFSSVNVLEYPAIRDGVKAFSAWPTIPQLYV